MPKYFQCRLCRQKFSGYENYKIHLRSHQNEPITPTVQCHQCANKFKSKKDLKAHTQTVHPVRMRTNKCPFCGKTFSESQSFIVHMSENHPPTNDSLHSNFKCVKKIFKREIYRQDFNQETHLNENLLAMLKSFLSNLLKCNRGEIMAISIIYGGIFIRDESEKNSDITTLPLRCRQYFLCKFSHIEKLLQESKQQCKNRIENLSKLAGSKWTFVSFSFVDIEMTPNLTTLATFK